MLNPSQIGIGQPSCVATGNLGWWCYTGANGEYYRNEQQVSHVEQLQRRVEALAEVLQTVSNKIEFGKPAAVTANIQ